MADVKWIKIATDIFDNRKIKQIEKFPDGDTILIIWFKLLNLAGVINDNGKVYLTAEIPFTEEMLATEFSRPLLTVRLALNTFQDFKMIEIIDSMLYISSWDRYQNIEGLDKMREQARLRQQKHRKSLELEDMSRDSHVTVTQCNAIEEEKEKEIDKDKDKKNSHFVPPTLEEVQSYCKERNNNVDANKFIDFYSSKGWMVGKNKMKDWEASVRTWEKDSKPQQQKPSNNKFNNFQQRDYNFDELEKQLIGNNN